MILTLDSSNSICMQVVGSKLATLLLLFFTFTISTQISRKLYICTHLYTIFINNIKLLINSADSEFVALSDCACPGHSQMFECRVVGEGATIWKGTAFECASTDNEIVLLHARSSSSSPLQCNDGAIQGRITDISTVNNTYTSQLSVSVSNELEGRSISCMHDSSSDGSINVIGSTLLMITTGIDNYR
jgi:hypothetical protein